MLEYNRINISEEIDINQTSASKKGNICYYWYFEDICFKHEPYRFNGCLDLMQKAMSLLIILLLSMLKEVLTEFIFDIWAKMIQLT